jgi:hypothetical protein
VEQLFADEGDAGEEVCVLGRSTTHTKWQPTQKWNFHVFYGNSIPLEMEVKWKPGPRTRPRSHLTIIPNWVSFVTVARYDRDRDRPLGFHITSISREVEFP